MIRDDRLREQKDASSVPLQCLRSFRRLRDRRARRLVVLPQLHDRSWCSRPQADPCECAVDRAMPSPKGKPNERARPSSV
jgi:hypothetical protein